MQTRTRVSAMLCAILLCVPTARASDELVWSAMIATTGTLDLLSTEAAIERGAHEVSPLPRWAGSTGRVALHAAGGATVIGIASLLKKKGRKKAAWGLVIALALAQSYAAIRNHRLER